MLQLWCWGFDILIFQKYKINYEFIFGKYKPQLVHTLDQFKIASCLPFSPFFLPLVYTLAICALFYLWFYCSFTEVILSKLQISLIGPASFIFFCFCVLPVPGQVDSLYLDLLIVFTLSMVHVSPLCKASLRSVLLCSLSGFLSGRSVHFAFSNTDGFASCLGQPLYGLLPELSRSIRQFFTHHTQCDSNIPFDSASIHSIGAESPTIP